LRTPSVAALRYAQALIEIPKELQEDERILGELEMILGSLKSLPPLGDLIRHPEIPLEEKERLLLDCFGEKVSQLVMNFVKLLVAEGRLGELEDIVAEYRRVLDEKRGFLRAKVRTWGPLPEEERQDLARVLSSMVGKRVELELVEDRSLLGGIIIYLDTKAIDGSIRGLLERLRREILR